MTAAIAGRATAEGTRRFADRHAGATGEGHFRPLARWTAGSIGLGTYLGEPDDATDAAVADAAVATLSAGCNVLDSAINYRHMRGERAVGQGLRRAIAEGVVQRDEVIVATKGGFIPFDGGPPADPAAYFRDEYLTPGVMQPQDLIAGCHCMTPTYLRNQVERSLANLGVETIDVYYVHNPETQLNQLAREEVMRRLQDAFGALEEEVRAGRIQVYGTATWDAYRQGPDARSHLNLADLVAAAEAAAGADHRFRVVQLPYNLALAEAHGRPTQTVGGRTMPALAAADALGIAVCVSVPLMQAQLCGALPPAVVGAFPNARTAAQQALQFVRSTPGVTTALAGMKTRAHCEENLATAGLPVDPAAVAGLFAAA